MRNILFDLLADVHLRLRYCAGYYEFCSFGEAYSYECSVAMMNVSRKIKFFWVVKERGPDYVNVTFREPEWARLYLPEGWED